MEEGEAAYRVLEGLARGSCRGVPLVFYNKDITVCQHLRRLPGLAHTKCSLLY